MNWQETRKKLISLGIYERSLPERWRFGIFLSGADLRGAVLSGAVLRGAVLRGADLSGANLSNTDLRGAVLSGAVLSNTDLSDAVLRGADLSNTDLSGAVLSGAVLRGADLSGANLSNTDLRGAVLSGADLSGADLPHPGFDPIPESELSKRILAHVDAKQDSLEMSSWHTCNTRHCAWGWATVENGDAGRALEYALGIEAAGAILFPSFAPFVTASNEKAIEELKRIAEGK